MRNLGKTLLRGFVVALFLAGAGLDAFGATSRVPEDYSTIQAAIVAAEPGDTVLVNDGTYIENIVLYKTITLRSVNGPDHTVIHGNSAGSSTVVVHAYPSCVISGFTIQNGSVSTNGGGISCAGPQAPTIEFCKVMNNHAESNGGGIYCERQCTPTMIGCTISNNSAGNSGGGIYCTNLSASAMTYCTISDNLALNSGGGVFCQALSAPTMTECVVERNTATVSGGGIYCSNASPPMLSKCIIRNNSTADSGAGLYCRYAAPPTMANCIISMNSGALYGAGVFCDNASETTIANCTISDNSASSAGGAVYLGSYSGVSTIVNSILWANTAGGSPDQIYLGVATANITFCDIHGGWEGYGNMDVDPKFLTPGEGDYHLQSNSLCIDAGTMGPGVPPDDIEGNFRDDRPDLGAYEYTVGEVEVSIDIKPGSDPNCFNNNGHGVIPVAILGDADFDVSHIDPATVTLEGLTVKAVGKSNKLLAHCEDVNMDGFEDLVVQIEDADGVFSEGQATATISGALYDGMPIQGSDSICIVP